MLFQALQTPAKWIHLLELRFCNKPLKEQKVCKRLELRFKKLVASQTTKVYYKNRRMIGSQTWDRAQQWDYCSLPQMHKEGMEHIE